MRNIGEYEPKKVWEIFSQICEIPHPSNHEGKLRKYLLDFGRKYNLDTVLTASGNIVMSKPATKGLENLKSVVLQAHMDMVPAKRDDVEHDFSKDSIKTEIIDGWLHAKGTTLGADNGVGLSYGLSIMQSEDIAHGPLKLLITWGEEVGLLGASGLLAEELPNSDILINLDNEEDNLVCIGCAGGSALEATMDMNRVGIDEATHDFFKLSIWGLISGHSAMDIDKSRGNAIKIIASILYELNKKFHMDLFSIDGGELSNSIPSFCDAIFSVKKTDKVAVKEFLKIKQQEIIAEFEDTEKHMKFSDKIIHAKNLFHKKAISAKDKKRLILCLTSLYDGLFKMDTQVNAVQTSSNLAIIKTHEDNVIVTTMERSSLLSAKQRVIDMLLATFELVDFKVKTIFSYQGWKTDLHSPIVKIVTDTYHRMFSEKMTEVVVHGGLECGVILGKIPQIKEAVSIGPNIFNPHSPAEKTEIRSVEKIYKLLLEVLKQIPRR